MLQQGIMIRPCQKFGAPNGARVTIGTREANTAFVHALETAGLKDFTLTDYRSHAIRGGSDSDSAAYIQLRSNENNRTIWGCGVDPSIEMAGLKSLVSSYNLLHG